jgi:hypothetical protein
MSTPIDPVPAKPAVFIGSSAEGQQISRYVQAELQAVIPCEVSLWSQGIFKPSGYTLDDLVEEARRSDFAVLVATPDDHVESRGEVTPTVRDNVILELGLFIGVLGRERTFVLADNAEGLRLPSDLQGLTWIPYDRRSDGRGRAAVGPAALAISERMRELRLRPGSSVSNGLHTTAEQRILAVEIERICTSALAQGWKVKTNSPTTLRLESRAGKRFTFSIGAASSSREKLRVFAAELRGGGLRVNRSVRQPTEDAPEAAI